MTSRGTSAERLRGKLSTSAMQMYQNEALYHAQVDWTCQLLDVVDLAADTATAMRITDAILALLAGDDAVEAVQRVRDTQAEMERLMSAAPDVRGFLP